MNDRGDRMIDPEGRMTDPVDPTTDPVDPTIARTRRWPGTHPLGGTHSACEARAAHRH